jgi:hypothetical protein
VNKVETSLKTLAPEKTRMEELTRIMIDDGMIPLIPRSCAAGLFNSGEATGQNRGFPHLRLSPFQPNLTSRTPDLGMRKQP